MAYQGTPDTVIIGAGIAGLSAAWYLTRAGQSVTLIDPTPGLGASHAAGGMIAPTSEMVYQHITMRTLMSASAATYPQFIAELEEAVGHSVGFRSTDTLCLAATPADRDAFANLAEIQQASGMQVDQLTTRQARQLEPALSPSIAGAFLVPGDHQVNPRRLIRGLCEAIIADGRSTLLPHRVTEIVRHSDGRATGVQCSDGSTIHAESILLSPGASIAGIDGVPEYECLRLRPIYGDVLRARLRPGHTPLFTSTIRGLVHGRTVYLIPRDDGEIVIGATEREDGLDGVLLEGAYQLLKDAQTIVPGTAHLELTEILARARPGTPDDLPYLGHLPGVRGLVVSTGYSRHGILLAPLGGHLAAKLILGEDPTGQEAAILTATAPERTPEIRKAR